MSNFKDKKILIKDINHFDTSFIDKEILDKKIPKQILWHIQNNLKSPPKCHNKNCNNSVSWQKSLQKYSQYCSPKCRATCDDFKEKQRKNYLEKYGVEHNFQSKTHKEKVKKTSMERYGVEHYSQNEKVQEKRIKTNIQKYGVEHHTKNKDFIDKQKQKNKEKYGVSTNLLFENIIKSRKEKNKKNYGVEYLFQSEEIRNKAIEKRKSTESINKFKQTLNERYDVNFISHINIPKESLKVLLDFEKFKDLLEIYSPHAASLKLGVDRNTIIRYCEIYKIIPKKYKSALEIDMALFLNELGVFFIQNEKNVISPFELDFYLPEYNLAIEMNGDYWHSDIFKDKKYHFNKWNYCKEKNIRLLTIFESEWYNKKEIIKDIIKVATNKQEKGIFARNSLVKPCTSAETKEFLDKYHIQGYVSGIQSFGAYDNNDDLIGVMTISYTRGLKKHRRLELRRWATNSKIHPGLFSKVFKFAQEYLNFNEIVSFSDNRFFTGNSYLNLGFEMKNILKPAYNYFYNDRLFHCSLFTKSNILKKFPEITQKENINEMTEKEMADYLKLRRIWDCGKIEWVWKKY